MANSKNSVWHLTRLLMVACWAVWILTFFMAVTLFQAVLQVDVLAQIVPKDVMSSMNWSDTTPISIVERKKIDDVLVRLFVTTRYSFISDRQEMTRRWGPGGVLAYLTTPFLYSNLVPDPQQYTDADERKRQRVVDIISSKRSDNYYTVVFDLYEATGYGDWTKSTHSVIVQFAYSRGRRTLRGLTANPYGFVVVRLDESKVNG